MLTSRQQTIVRDLCMAGDGSKASLGVAAIAGALNPEEIDLLCELISNEFMMNGILESFEPNEYGKELETLLDSINRPRLQGDSPDK